MERLVIFKEDRADGQTRAITDEELVLWQDGHKIGKHLLIAKIRFLIIVNPGR